MGEATITRRGLLGGAAASVALATTGRGARAAGADGQLTWAAHVRLAAGCSVRVRLRGFPSPFGVVHPRHDGVVTPRPGQATAPRLAESWVGSEDGLFFDFVLREGATFHDGEPVTADDVKFSFER